MIIIIPPLRNMFVACTRPSISPMDYQTIASMLRSYDTNLVPTQVKQQILIMNTKQCNPILNINL